ASTLFQLSDCEPPSCFEVGGSRAVSSAMTVAICRGAGVAFVVLTTRLARCWRGAVRSASPTPLDCGADCIGTLGAAMPLGRTSPLFWIIHSSVRSQTPRWDNTANAAGQARRSRTQGQAWREGRARRAWAGNRWLGHRPRPLLCQRDPERSDAKYAARFARLVRAIPARTHQRRWLTASSKWLTPADSYDLS